jgi:hypothetical protein
MTTMSCSVFVEAITGEGRVSLRRVPVDLGLGLWLNEPAAKTHAAGLARPRQDRPATLGDQGLTAGLSARHDQVHSQARCQRLGLQSAHLTVGTFGPPRREASRET